MVERALRAAGLRTGRYTSPHLARIEERAAIDGVAVDAGTFAEVERSELGARELFLLLEGIEVVRERVRYTPRAG